jgi:ATP-binding cassette subfamily B protein
MKVLGDRLDLLRALRAAGPPVVAGLAVVLVAGACVPGATAVVLGWAVSRSGAAGAAALPLVALGGVVLAGHAADALAKPLEFAARARIDGAHRHDILLLTTGGRGIALLEDPEVQGLIRRAGAEPDYGVTSPADGALVQLRWLAGLLGVAAACTVVGHYRWWLVPVLLVPAVLGLALRTRQYFAAVSSLRDAVREELHADVWRQAVSVVAGVPHRFTAGHRSAASQADVGHRALARHVRLPGNRAARALRRQRVPARRVGGRDRRRVRLR